MPRDMVREVRAQRPDVVLTFDLESGYSWHRDHQAVGRAARVARALAADAAFRPDLGEPHTVRWLAYVLVPRGVMRMFGGERGAAVVAHQVAPELAAPIDRRLKIRGWSVHESQYGYLRRVWGVPPWLLYAFHDKEHYALAKDED